MFTLAASLAPSGNEVLCDRMRFDSNDATPAITAELRVVWNNRRTVDNPENASGMYKDQYDYRISHDIDIAG
jgi:hypothetical protein